MRHRNCSLRGWRIVAMLIAPLMVSLISSLILLPRCFQLRDAAAIDFSRTDPQMPSNSSVSNGSERARPWRQQHVDNENRAFDPSNMTFMGISSNADEVSDSAILFLVEAACVHGVKSYVLLGEKDLDRSLKKKILAVAYHRHFQLPLRNDTGGLGDNASPRCVNWIRVRVAPDRDILLNSTRDFIHSTNGDLSPKTLNSPLDPDSRIATIKRTREYQRLQLLQNNIFWGIRAYDWRHDTVIGVLDMDLFGYPPIVADVVDVATRYVIPPAGQYHAICANGLQVSHGAGSYYDTFSTILASGEWLYRKSDRAIDFPLGARPGGDDVDPAQMTQRQILRWFSERGGPRADPVPVRSCFGGFALYRADAYFDSGCRYDSYHWDDVQYASRSEGQACEHIVFNECLRRRHSSEGSNYRIAVKPDLLTMWHLLN